MIKHGEHGNTSGMDIYVTTSKLDEKWKNGQAIVCAYDIFGMHASTQQFCDLLSKETCSLVVMPDFFRGKPWRLEDYPPKADQDLMGWISKAGSHEMVLKDLNDAVLPWLKSQWGVERSGFLGFCWGGKQAIQVAADPKMFVGVATAHPAFLTVEDAEKVSVPMCLLLSKNEPEWDDVKKTLEERAKNNFDLTWQRFDDVHHGWCSARMDRKDDVNLKRATEALHIFVDFFKKQFLTCA
eukprot:CAMPEP_0201552526 /NCGR_PEP_ID=MMETSP0173_2-20130828/16770_1 /ASSEMBLY_ACC=CAM_ASM_000268 /TAXON_ID=218659 /ORGANISM="Vexillifera sp., Strain DIVA3 564/2" /LENGTH=238 /DNA_ID=CAMNT_0047963027 /DNA_START=109 /DNA_END=825 /DNA_ORIENTATION=-